MVPPRPPEAGIEIVLCSPDELTAMISSGEFDHALHLAAVQLAIVAGKLSLPHSVSKS
jgi:hypothetical protein